MTYDGVATLPKELKFNQIRPSIQGDAVLRLSGWFYLKEVFEVLDDGGGSRYKLAFKQIERLREKGEDPYEIMGYKKFGGRVGVLMERFGPWYEDNLILKAGKLDGSMSFPTFVRQRNCFYRLSEVCKYYKNYLPYTYSILKRNADKTPESIQRIGVVKYDTTYLVKMPRFQEWLREQML